MAECLLHAEVLAQIDAAHGRIAHDFVGVAVGQHLAFADDVGAVADAQRFAHVVVGDQHADAAALQEPHNALDFDDGDGVHAGKGLVQQDEARAGRQRARNFDAAAFAA
ncbi:hypothetical protein G6F65_022297 [Rhizopus arrhizus]|nr:hypothetical protein G6F65_022297 [Rhizopus arrhizus]